nr:hypothetical protein [Desulfobacterales bacterium]
MSQLRKLPLFPERRREIAGRYGKAFQGFPVKIPDDEIERYSIFFVYVLLREEWVESFIQKMTASGVEVRRPVFRPLHRLWVCCVIQTPSLLGTRLYLCHSIQPCRIKRSIS